MQKNGIIIGSDKNLEYLIPAWRIIYNKSNKLPVTFFDFGVSCAMKNFCKSHFNYINLEKSIEIKKSNIDLKNQSNWEEFYQNDFWDKRNGWFKKALACKHSPYELTLWIDLDCLVYKDLSLLFSMANNVPFLSLAADENSRMDLQLKLDIRNEREKIYNSGVILYSKNHPIIEEWADQCIHKNHLFIGDQHALSRVIYEKNWPIFLLPKEYNWPYHEEKKTDVVIEHFFGLGKKNLLEEILFFQKV